MYTTAARGKYGRGMMCSRLYKSWKVMAHLGPVTESAELWLNGIGSDVQYRG